MRSLFKPSGTVLALAIAILLPLRAGAVEDYERWYVIELGGDRAGWAMSSQQSAAGSITTRSATHLEIRRENVSVSVSTEAEFVETPDGRPLTLKVTRRLGAAPTVLEARYSDTGVDVALTTLGRTERRTVPLPDGQWLTPAAAARYVHQRLAANAGKIVVRAIEPGGGGLDPMQVLQPVIVTRSRLEPATVRVMGRDVAGQRCLTESSAQPGIQATEVIDERGVPIVSETVLGPWRLTMTAAERGAALAALEAPEVMVTTFVRPDRPILRPRTLRRAVYIVSAATGELPPIPDAAAQAVETLDLRRSRVVLDTARRDPANPADAANPAYLAGSALINVNDEVVRDLHRRAVPDGNDSTARAESFRRFVHGYIRAKSLDVGFASAAEVARSRAGDCTEHAVLLAALLRADGIPARVVSGLIYADEFAGEKGIFAYHMWTQALLPMGDFNTWVDLDATLSAPFDAAHIALVVSALADGGTDDVFVSLATLLGRLRINVEEVR